MKHWKWLVRAFHFALTSHQRRSSRSGEIGNFDFPKINLVYIKRRSAGSRRLPPGYSFCSIEMSNKRVIIQLLNSSVSTEHGHFFFIIFRVRNDFAVVNILEHWVLEFASVAKNFVRKLSGRTVPGHLLTNKKWSQKSATVASIRVQSIRCSHRITGFDSIAASNNRSKRIRSSSTMNGGGSKVVSIDVLVICG